MQTYQQFTTKLRGRIWPGREPANLVAPHDAMFQTAMLELQKWVPCLKEYNISTYESADREWDGAKTRVQMPNGQIRRVYTVAGGTDRWRDRVFYRSSNVREMECWARNLMDAETPPLPDLGYGVRAESESSDWEHGRARQGIWAHYRGKLYMAPWLQTYELLVVEWDGEKQEWQAGDGVDPRIWRHDAEMAVELYVKWRHEQSYGDIGISREIKATFDRVLADLMHWCRENTRQRQDEICASEGGTIDPRPAGTDDLSEDDEDPTENTTDEDEVLFNAVGDLGDDTEAAAAVAEAVIADNPEVFIALGDLTYNDDFEADFGVKYSALMTGNKLIPVPGNHDVIDGSLNTFSEYFADFVGNNGRNYEATIGPCHILVYNTEDTDGIDPDSAQAEWLRAKLLLSTARWKIVVMHKAPYSSDSTHGSNADLQFPWEDWGAVPDVIIAAHAHDYERLEVGGVPYFVVGTGGHSLRDFGSAVDGSQFRDNTHYGRLIGEVNCDRMILSFKSVDNEVLDSLTITKE